MAADTFSSTLGTLIMGTGNDNNSWGENANNDVFAVMEAAIAGQSSRSVTGGTLDLSASPPPAGPSGAIEAIFKFTGTLISDQTFIVPNVTKKWVIYNGTSGSFDLFMKTTSGTAILIPQGAPCNVYCDGNNVMRRIGARTGEIFMHAGTTAPAGALVCNGAAISRTGKGLELFGVIGTTWGIGNNVSTFNIPDLQTDNRFPRSSGGSLTVGTTQTDDNVAHTHTGTANVTGTATGTTDPDGEHAHDYSGTTGSENQSHTHDQIASTANGSYAGASSNGPFGNHSQTGTESQSHQHDYSGTTEGTDDHTHNFTGDVTASGAFTTDSSGGTETRPNAAVVLMCIYL